MKQIFLFIFCVLFIGIASYGQKTYLLSVGIADYPGNDNDLLLPVNDARSMQRLYQKNKNVETILLTNEQCTRSNIVQKMKELFGKAGKNDIVVFFFSGHGYDGGFAAYDEGLSYADVKSAIGSSRSMNKMIFADACYSGNMRQDRSGGHGNISPSSLNVLLFLASRTNEYSIEQPSGNVKNGYFTGVLERGLRGGADVNKDRIITAKELFKYVSPRVIKLTHDEQHPVMWGKFNDNMAIIKW